MKYLLIMQLILSGFNEGGAAIETVKFDSLSDCNRAKSTFLLTMRVDKKLEPSIYRKAECIQISESY